jgi:hypothetical protein
MTIPGPDAEPSTHMRLSASLETSIATTRVPPSISASTVAALVPLAQLVTMMRWAIRFIRWVSSGCQIPAATTIWPRWCAADRRDVLVGVGLISGGRRVAVSSSMMTTRPAGRVSSTDRASSSAARTPSPKGVRVGEKALVCSRNPSLSLISVCARRYAAIRSRPVSCSRHRPPRWHRSPSSPGVMQGK